VYQFDCFLGENNFGRALFNYICSLHFLIKTGITMKRLFALLVMGGFLFAATSCAKSSEASEETMDAASEIVEETEEVIEEVETATEEVVEEAEETVEEVEEAVEEATEAN
jgi:sensor histidine kinase regulating citrate/malate metabolism